MTAAPPEERTPFRLPSLGSDMDAGTVLEWRVGVGDAVHRGDVIVLVDTEKSEIEVEVWQDGVVAELLVAVGDQVPVGTPLALLAPPGTSVSPAAAVPAAPPAVGAPHPVEPSPPASPSVAPTPVGDEGLAAGAPPPVPDGDRPVAAPPPRDRDAFTPTPRTVYWPRGLVAPAPPRGGPPREPEAATDPVVAPVAEDRPARIRRMTAELMSRANRDIPHYHLTLAIDLAPALGWLTAVNADLPAAQRILPAALLVKATARAARAVPELNGYWGPDGFEPADEVNVGMAVHLRTGGLVAPAIMDADSKALDRVMADLRDLVARARAGRLRAGEMAGGTLTVTNLGDRGVDSVAGVIHAPQVALVGFGRVRDRPVVVDGVVVVHPVVVASLAADHRATDGQTGAAFLNEIERQLHHPEAL